MVTGKKKLAHSRDETKPVCDEYAGWWRHPKWNIHAHFVPARNKKLTNMALCGLRLFAADKKWEAPTGRESNCPQCLHVLEQQQERAKRDLPQIPADANEHVVNFVQTIGEVIPLCWIPVADVQMLVKLLHQHMPEPMLRASREQFLGIIKALNEYVGEALDRNAKAEAGSTLYEARWTEPEPAKKGKK